MEDNNTLSQHSVNDAEFWQKRYDDGYLGGTSVKFRHLCKPISSIYSTTA